MKFSAISTVIATVFFFSSVMTAPIAEETAFSSNSTDLPKASITISNPSVVPPPAVTIADTMSGTTAIASITIKGHDVSAQSVSGSRHNFVGPAIALPIAIISAITLV